MELINNNQILKTEFGFQFEHNLDDKKYVIQIVYPQNTDNYSIPYILVIPKQIKEGSMLAVEVNNYESEEKNNLINKALVTARDLTENEFCSICSDLSRNCDILCVVEDVKTVFLFEKQNMFNGKYHVLEGLISPLEGINPEDIKINQLINRVKNGKIKEIILALNPSMEGETTALYISKMLEGLDIKVTKIAAGVPVGADMEYLDSITIQRALEGRTEIS